MWNKVPLLRQPFRHVSGVPNMAFNLVKDRYHLVIIFYAFSLCCTKMDDLALLVQNFDLVSSGIFITRSLLQFTMYLFVYWQ